MRLRLLSPHYWPTWAGMLVLRLLAGLPYRALLSVGAALGCAMRHLPLRFIRIARRNIELCLPELSAPERQQLLDRHFRSLGIALLEAPLAWWRCAQDIDRIVKVEGREHIDAALALGKGVILLTAHFTPMDMGGRILARVVPLNIMYRPSKNAVLAWFLGRCRSRHGGTSIARDDIRALISALKNNGCVYYAPDQAYRKKGAEMVPLFGIPAASNTFTSRLAKMTGATVLPFFVERLPGTQGYLARVHPPFKDFPSESPAADTERFHQLIEAQVRNAPEQYLWIHRRFKGLSDDYPDYYGRKHPTAAPTIPERTTA
jgi:Kdo2-lipid IVA lauroyltransferase/acyltransferase